MKPACDFGKPEEHFEGFSLPPHPMTFDASSLCRLVCVHIVLGVSLSYAHLLHFPIISVSLSSVIRPSSYENPSSASTPTVYCFASRPVSVSSASLVLERVYVGADLQGRSQFDVETRHEVVFGEEQQSLAVDLLGAERLGHVPTAWQRVDEGRHLLHAPL